MELSLVHTQATLSSGEGGRERASDREGVSIPTHSSTIIEVDHDVSVVSRVLPSGKCHTHRLAILCLMNERGEREREGEREGGREGGRENKLEHYYYILA